MANSAGDKHSDGDINKEEGEITDDDENEDVKAEIDFFQREDKYLAAEKKRYKNFKSSLGLGTFCSSKSDGLRETGNFSSSSNESPAPRSRNYRGLRTRSFQESLHASSPSSRSYNSSESPLAYKGTYRIGSRPDRRANNYRDYHNQKDRQYGQPPQSPSLQLPNAARCIL